MTTTIFNAGSDAHVLVAQPSRAHGGPAQLAVDNVEAWALYYFPLGARIPKGATVTEARFKVGQHLAVPGSLTLVARRVGLWVASKVTWNNKPAAAAGSVDISVTRVDAANSTYWTFDVTDDVVAFLAGGANYGWRITRGPESATRRYLRGFQAASTKPVLEVDWTILPAAPTDLRPSYGAVSVTKPVLSWTAPDMSSFQVQIDAAGDFVTPDFDSGEVAETVPLFDLAGSAYGGNTGTTQWRVRVWNDSGVGAWSQVAEWPYAALPVVTITNPPAVTEDPTPPVVWTAPGQTQRRVIVRNAAGVLVEDSKWATTAELDHTPSKGATRDGQVLSREVQVRDDEIREATPGAPTYATDTQVSTFEFDPTPDPVLWLDVTQDDVTPWVTLKWDRAEVPDGWRIIRDGEIIAALDDTDPAFGDIFVWTDWTAAPNHAHTYRVAPGVGGVVGSGGPTVTFTPQIKGIWLGDPANTLDVLVLGRDEPEAAYTEDGESYRPHGGTSVVNSLTALRGFEGSVTGTVADVFDRIGADEVATLYDIKGRPLDEYRLVWADVNIPVRVRNVNPGPRRLGTTPASVTRTVSFEFAQDGELPFEWAGP